MEVFAGLFMVRWFIARFRGPMKWKKMKLTERCRARNKGSHGWVGILGHITDYAESD